MLTRDRGGPAVCFQYLHSPALDDRLATPSAVEFTDTPVWNRRNAVLSWEAYLAPASPVPRACRRTPPPPGRPEPNWPDCRRPMSR
nr:hypothetical protein [Streptomyces sp. NRRL S-813]